MMHLLLVSAPLLARGAAVTVYLSLVAILLSTALGLVLALAQLYGGIVLRTVVEAYLYVVRGVPLLVLLFAMYYALPYAGIALDPMAGGIVVISLYFAAFMTEVFRGAVLSVPAGQWDAGRAIGLTTRRILTDIVFRQALRVAAPPFVNTCIMVVKGTSLVSIIGLADLTYVGKAIVERTLAPFEIFGVVALAYLALCLVLSRLGRRLETRLSYVH
jgi:His/Glu/Gln/Arg/opine family amino acid ABC transporter permease subunit